MARRPDRVAVTGTETPDPPVHHGAASEIARAQRQAYVRDAVETVSPGRLVVMLYDRLSRDLGLASDAVAAGDVAAAHEQLVHAQEIVVELLSALDTKVWPPAARLADIYRYVLEQLVTANVHKDRDRIDAARQVIEPLRAAWREVSGAVVPRARAQYA